jgi:hypothetical protein
VATVRFRIVHRSVISRFALTELPSNSCPVNPLRGNLRSNGNTADVSVSLDQSSIARGDSILEADMSFHMAVGKAARSELLTSAVQLLRNLMR